MSPRDMPEAHDCGCEAAAYVLGALDPEEMEAFERHLAECAVCRDEVAAFGHVVDALPMAAPQFDPPRRLRRNVLRTVRREAKATRGRRPAPPWDAMWARRGALVAGSCAAVALGALIGLEASGGSAARVIEARVAGVPGAASVRLSGGRGELILRHFAPPPPGDVYELWLKRGAGAPMPTSVLFSVTSSGAGEVGLPPRLHGVSEILVTPEPKGGSAFPTHKPVIVAPLT